MLIVLKYMFFLLFSILSVVSSGDAISRISEVTRPPFSWFKKIPWRRRVFWWYLLVLASTWGCAIWDDLSSRIDNDEQRRTLYDQTRQLNSVLYNIETSIEGKQRFLKPFKNLARAAKIDTSLTGFEGLVCDDGVALYWFDSETEQITGFHFFSNAEINNVLRGVSLGSPLADKTENPAIGNATELSIALKSYLFSEIPTKGDNSLDRRRNEEEVLAEVETVLRYVYRAEDIRIRPYRREVLGKPTGNFSLSFSYVVNPYAETVRTRSIGPTDLELTGEFIDSLYGLAKATVSERIIAYFRRHCLEPKVRVDDLRLLHTMRAREDQIIHSPFTNRKRKQIEGYVSRVGLRVPVLDDEGIYVVGYSGVPLSDGLNRIEVGFDPVDQPFPTLDSVVSFEPKDAIVGDELRVLLDTKERRYRFDSYDGTNYVLKTLGEKSESTTSLDSIPWCRQLWIGHRNGKAVRLLTSGSVAGKYKSLLNLGNGTSGGRMPDVKVYLADPTEIGRYKRVVELKGGRIRLCDRNVP